MIDKINKQFYTTKSTIYDTNSLTILESIGKFLEKINEIVENFNTVENDFNNLDSTTKEKINFMINNLIPESVENEFNIQCSNGTITTLINKELFSELNNKINIAIANLTNGDNANTLSEVVLARMGYTSLSEFLEYLLNLVEILQNNVFLEGLENANISDFYGNCTPNFNETTLNAYRCKNTFQYLECNTNELQFTINENISYLLLGKSNMGLIGIQIREKSGAYGNLIKFNSTTATTIKKNVLNTQFINGDICRIKYSASGNAWALFKNNNYVGIIYENDYDFKMGSHNLGFIIANVDKENTQIVSNIASNIYLRKYTKSIIKENNESIETIQNYINEIDKILYEKSYKYEENYKNFSLENTENGNNFIENNGNISLKGAPPTDNILIPLLINTNKIKFTINKTDTVVLNGNTDNYVCIWVKHDTKPDMVGKLATNINGTVRTQYIYSIQSANEGDNIEIIESKENFTFNKNNKLWFVIDKSKTPLINWDKSKSILGIIANANKYENLCSNIQIVSNTLIKVPISEKVKNIYNLSYNYNYATFIGDSISAGYGNNGYISSTHEGGISWIDTFINIKNIPNYTRLATGGILLSRDMLNRIDNIPDKSELNIIFGGYNDFLVGVPIGNNADETFNTTIITYNNKQAEVPDSFYGAIDTLIKKLMNKFPNGNNILITPLHCKKENVKNSKGLILHDYQKAIIEKCEKYGIKFIDGFNIPLSPLIEFHNNNYYHDGLHPTESGDILLANELSKIIK